jgi:hypothetical protein
MNQIKAKSGDRIRLVRMGADDPCPIEPGSEGTVASRTELWDGFAQVDVKWDSGRTLMLAEPEDLYVIVSCADGEHEYGPGMPTCRRCPHNRAREANNDLGGRRGAKPHLG